MPSFRIFSHYVLLLFCVDKIAGVKDVCADLNGTSPLLDETDGNMVNVPLKWLMLAPGEELVAAIGQKYNLNCGEIVLAILSFGIYYFIRLRIKSWQRSAIFITTKRIIEMTVNQHKGRIPVAFTGFRAVVRSYFPGDIDSGFIRGTGSRVISTLMTSSGTIVATLPRIHLPFAHRMHLTASRIEPNLQSFEGVRYRLPERFQFVRPEELEGRGRGMLSDTDLALLPSLYEEEIVSRFVGGIKYTPCCPASPVYYCERFWNPRWVDSKPQVYVCTYTSAFKKIAIFFSMLVTCCFKPVKRRNDAIITTHTMYYVSSGPNPLEPFFLTWVAIKSIKGSSSTVKARGAHPFKNCTCCCIERRAIIAKGSSTYEIQVRTSLGFTLPFSFSIPFHNWLEDENYAKMIAVLGAADVRLIDDL